MVSRARRLYESVRQLLEASLGRALQHAYGKDYNGNPISFVILTSDKGAGFYFESGDEVDVGQIQDFSNFNQAVKDKQSELRKAKIRKEVFIQQENNKRREQLKNDLRSDDKGGYGYFPVKGHYVENADLPENDSVESSFFVIDYDNGNPQKFLRLMAYLGAKYDQECIAYKDPRGNYWWYHTIDHVDYTGKKWKKGAKQPIGDKMLVNIKKLEGGFSTIKNKTMTLGYDKEKQRRLEKEQERLKRKEAKKLKKKEKQ